MTDLPSTPPQCVIVLGMHRSGTSLLTGSLEAAGLHLGEVNNAARYNPKGNKENESIRRFHNGLLSRYGTAWDRPPKHQVQWTAADEKRARALIEPYFHAARPWGFKDPRTVWTIEGWLRIVPGARMIAVFRHPSLVARSLGARRQSIGPDDALRLWCAYNCEIVRLQGKYGFPLLHFGSGRALRADFINPLTSFARSMGLPGPPDRFFDGALVHQTEPEPIATTQARHLFERMIALSRAASGTG